MTPLDIRHLADVWPRSAGHDRAVEIRIALESTDPPSGRVLRMDDGSIAPAAEGGQPFSGWLDLLRALYDLLPAPVDRSTA